MEDDGEREWIMGQKRLSGLALVGIVALAIAAIVPVHVVGQTRTLDVMVDSSLPPARFPFRSYGAELGLLSFAVNSITQDSDGLLWAGTEDGLYRFDGGEFVRFGLAEGLPSTNLSALAVAAPRTVWAGTIAGLAWFDGIAFHAVEPREGLSRAAVNGLGFDSNGALLVANEDGLFSSEAGRRSFSPVVGWPAESARALFVSPRGGAVLAATGTRVGRRSEAGQWEFWDFASLSGEENITSLAMDGQGRTWVRSVTHLLRAEPGSTRFEDVSSLMPPGRSGSTLCLDRAGNLWIPTQRGVIQHINGVWASIGGIGDGFATWAAVVFEDREGSLWIGGTGLYRLAGNGAWSSWGVGEGMPEAALWCVFRDSARRLWIGNRAGLLLASEMDFTVVPGTENLMVRSIVEAADGRLWAAGAQGAFYRYDPRSSKLDTYGVENGVPLGITWDLLVDREGTLWAATASGLLRYVSDGGLGRFVPEQVPGAMGRSLRTLVLDRRGRIWMAGTTGLFCREGGVWRHYSTADGLRQESVAFCLVDSRGQLSVAYVEPLGVDRFEVENGRLRHIETLDRRTGLTSDKVYFLGEDSRNQLWIGLAFGVDVVTSSGVRHFGVTDGLVGEDCNSNAFLADSNGDVFVGTSFGLGRFRGGLAVVQPTPPPARIIRATLGGSALAPGTSSLSTANREATFEARFSGVSFINEHQVRHEVRLLGYEPEWRPSRVREARYPKLPPGKYRFEVRARFGTGPWGEVAALDLEVKAK